MSCNCPEGPCLQPELTSCDCYCFNHPRKKVVWQGMQQQSVGGKTLTLQQQAQRKKMRVSGCEMQIVGESFGGDDSWL
jgi:uncharacterized Fe-S cluster-containing radical SAM superfamily protein